MTCGPQPDETSQGEANSKLRYAAGCPATRAQEIALEHQHLVGTHRGSGKLIHAAAARTFDELGIGNTPRVHASAADEQSVIRGCEALQHALASRKALYARSAPYGESLRITKVCIAVLRGDRGARLRDRQAGVSGPQLGGARRWRRDIREHRGYKRLFIGDAKRHVVPLLEAER
jgi:hypothetical protein